MRRKRAESFCYRKRERWSDDVAIVHISVLVGNAMQRFDVLAPNLVGCQFAHSVLSKIGFLLPFNTLACQSKEDWFHLEIVFLFAKAGFFLEMLSLVVEIL